MSLLSDPSHELEPTAPVQVRTTPDAERVVVRDARSKHFQDQPYMTSALLGALMGGVGGGVIKSLATGEPMPDLTWQSGLTGAGLGAVAGLANELMARGLVRTVGPEFKTKSWMRDQDPHRFNTALRATPAVTAYIALQAIRRARKEQHG